MRTDVFLKGLNSYFTQKPSHESGVDWIGDLVLDSYEYMSVANVTDCNGLMILDWKPSFLVPPLNLLILHAYHIPYAGHLSSYEARRLLTGRTNIDRKNSLLFLTKLFIPKRVRFKKEVGSCGWTGPHLHIEAFEDSQSINQHRFHAYYETTTKIIF